MKPGDANKSELLMILKSTGYKVLTEHVFHPTRKWRFDYALPEIKVAVEYQGHSGFVGKGSSGHSTIKGLTNDCEKSNAAQSLGWRILSFTALHFRASERAKHNLRSPGETVTGFLNETSPSVDAIEKAKS